MSKNLCIICGDEIPEGRQACPNCERKINGEIPNYKAVSPYRPNWLKRLKNLFK